MKWLKDNVPLALFIYALSSTLYAYTTTTVLSIAAGLSQQNFNNLHLPVTAVERDTLHQNNTGYAWIGAMGLGYDFLLDSHACNTLHDILIGLNIYNVNFENNGTVYQYGDSSLNNFTYQLPVYTTRLMFDARVVAQTWHNLAPYLLAGVGLSWNRTSYQDKPTTSGSTPIALVRREQLGFAYEAGVGVQYALSKKVSLFVEYLYANLGDSKTSASGSMNIFSPVTIPLHINSGLLGLNYTF